MYQVKDGGGLLVKRFSSVTSAVIYAYKRARRLNTTMYVWRGPIALASVTGLL